MPRTTFNLNSILLYFTSILAFLTPQFVARSTDPSGVQHAYELWKSEAFLCIGTFLCIAPLTTQPLKPVTCQSIFPEASGKPGLDNSLRRPCGRAAVDRASESDVQDFGPGVCGAEGHGSRNQSKKPNILRPVVITTQAPNSHLLHISLKFTPLPVLATMLSTAAKGLIYDMLVNCVDSANLRVPGFGERKQQAAETG